MERSVQTDPSDYDVAPLAILFCRSASPFGSSAAGAHNPLLPPSPTRARQNAHAAAPSSPDPQPQSALGQGCPTAGPSSPARSCAHAGGRSQARGQPSQAAGSGVSRCTSARMVTLSVVTRNRERPKRRIKHAPALRCSPLVVKSPAPAVDAPARSRSWTRSHRLSTDPRPNPAESRSVLRLLEIEEGLLGAQAGAFSCTFSTWTSTSRCSA